jgi:branched-chain amino acid transport system substrate-binding protein
MRRSSGKSFMGTKFTCIAATIVCLFGASLIMPPASQAEDKVIKIGAIAPLSGPLQPIGVNCKRGLLMAVDKINKAGGIKSMGGAKFKVVFEDDEAKPNVGMAVAERLIKQEKVDVLMGAYTSSVSFPVTQVAERYKVPIMVPTSAKDEITERGFQYTFRLVNKASDIAKHQLDFLVWLSKTKGVPIKTVGLLFEDSGWGQSLAKNHRKLIKKYGFEVVADLSYSKDTKDVRSTILKLKAAKPDVVIQESYTMDAILITKTMNELQFYAKAIVGTGTGHSNAGYHKGTGNLKAYMMQWEGWNPAIPLPEVKALDKEFQKMYNMHLDVYAAYWYTSMFSLAKAYEMTGSLDKQKLMEALHKVKLNYKENGNLCLFPIYYDKSGQDPDAAGIFTQWINGKMEIIYPENGATAKAVFPVPPWSDRK